jgi:hypothetical protein
MDLRITEKARKNYTLINFDSIKEGLFTPEQVEAKIFHELLNRHPDKDIKIGVGIKYFQLSFGKGYEVKIIRLDDTIERFSWLWCCKKSFSKSNEYKLTEAFRNCIYDDIIDYREKNENRYCMICDTSENIQIDHIYPFSLILKRFKNKKERTYPTEFDKNKWGSCIFKDEDQKLKNRFYKYHKRKAEYQYLCGTCNKKKSNKI